MKISLPQHRHNEPVTIESNGNPVVIVGANGAGKSRFTTQLVTSLGKRAFALSALHGLYVRDSDLLRQSSVGKICEPEVVDSVIRDGRSNELDLLLSQLMHDEMLNLLNYKLLRAEGRDAALQRTRLDRVIELWQDVFPGNKILVESGRFLFSRGNADDRYSAFRLSDGEQAVIYYIAGVLYAPQHSAIFINSPEMFLHPTIMQALWSRIEMLRPDCTFIYTTHDLEFTSSRAHATVVWVRDYDKAAVDWDYSVLDDSADITEDVYQAIIGARKPVLFIEGDGVHSIDSKLYPLVFKEFTVKSLGSCNKVIEATRSFNDLNGFHHMDSYGIVDRDRRDDHEVQYLRGKRVMVPEVAEIENILMLEDVIKAVARSRGRDPKKVFDKVSHAVITQFSQALKQQALLHTRHRVKRTVEYRIDGRFNSIAMLESHIMKLHDEIAPRQIYEQYCRQFRQFVEDRDYAAVLKVYNQKSMLPASNVASLCGLHNKDEYVAAIIDLLRHPGEEAQSIRQAVKRCFGLDSDIAVCNTENQNPT